MSIGRTREEQALTTMLAEQLVEREVMQPMASIGWGHNSPPAPAAGTTPPPEGAPLATPNTGTLQPTGLPGQPVTSPNVPASPSTANTPDLLAQLESMKDANGLYLGKYKTQEEAIKGVGHAVQMAKQAFNERDALTRELMELKQARTNLPPSPSGIPSQPIPVASRAAMDAAQAKLDAVLASVVDNGGVFDEERARKLSDAQRELSTAHADYAFDSRTATQRAEQEKWNAADRYMTEKHPDSLKFVDEIGVHVTSDPLLQEAVAALVAQGKLNQASELAWTSYKRSSQLQTTLTNTAEATAIEAKLAAGEQVRKELVDQARINAGVITGSTGGQGAHEIQRGGASQEEIDRLSQNMRREGMTPGTAAGQAFRDLVIGPSLDPRFFG